MTQTGASSWYIGSTVVSNGQTTVVNVDRPRLAGQLFAYNTLEFELQRTQARCVLPVHVRSSVRSSRACCNCCVSGAMVVRIARRILFNPVTSLSWRSTKMASCSSRIGCSTRSASVSTSLAAPPPLVQLKPSTSHHTVQRC
jgi:hypothetical protein